MSDQTFLEADEIVRHYLHEVRIDKSQRKWLVENAPRFEREIKRIRAWLKKAPTNLSAPVQQLVRPLVQNLELELWKADNLIASQHTKVPRRAAKRPPFLTPLVRQLHPLLSNKRWSGKTAARAINDYLKNNADLTTHLERQYDDFGTVYLTMRDLGLVKKRRT